MDLWTTRDKRVLDAIVFIDKRDQRPVRNIAELAEMTGLDHRQVQRSVGVLIDDDLASGASHKGLDGGTDYARVQPTPNGYRRAGEWPNDDHVENLLRVLELAQRETEDEDDRTALAEASKSLRSISEQTLGNVLGTFVAGLMKST